MSWNSNKDKNKEQPRRRGVKGKLITFKKKFINIAWEDEEVKEKPKFIKKNNQNDYSSNTNTTSNTNFENYYMKSSNGKSAYENAYNDYNKQNNISDNPISKNDIYNNPNLYKNSNM